MDEKPTPVSGVEERGEKITQCWDEKLRGVEVSFTKSRSRRNPIH